MVLNAERGSFHGRGAIAPSSAITKQRRLEQTCEASPAEFFKSEEKRPNGDRLTVSEQSDHDLVSLTLDPVNFKSQ